MAPDNNLVFPFDKDNVNRALTSALKRAGVKHVRFHDLRHTYASMQLADGNPVEYVAQQMGHADPSITYRTYVKPFDPAKQREEARKKMEEKWAGVLG